VLFKNKKNVNTNKYNFLVVIGKMVVVYLRFPFAFGAACQTTVKLEACKERYFRKNGAEDGILAPLHITLVRSPLRRSLDSAVGTIGKTLSHNVPWGRDWACKPALPS
jgi:hypothetical protein